MHIITVKNALLGKIAIVIDPTVYPVTMVVERLVTPKKIFIELKRQYWGCLINP